MKSTFLKKKYSQIFSFACLALLCQSLGGEAKSQDSSQATQNQSFNPQEDSPSINPSDIVHWKAKNSYYSPDGTVTVHVQLRTENNYSLYADQVQFTSRSGYDLVDFQSPPADEIEDPISGNKVPVYSQGEFILSFKGKLAYEQAKFPLSIRYIACSVRICLFPYTEEIEADNYKQTKPTNSVLTAPNSDNHKNTHTLVYGEEQTLEERLAEKVQSGQLNLLMILLALFLGGLLTNLTPCVYPMFPITIRLLSMQTKKPLHASLAYAGGIILVYSLLGLSVAYTGSLFGQYMSNPLLNTVLALIMFLLGVSMLGFGKWRMISNLGHKIGIDKPSVKQAFFMGCGAGLVASPCTGPILASILTYIAANKDLTRSTLYIFTYSLGFALPYVLIGDLSGHLAKRKISGKTQNLVKVCFASIMFALSFYYLRIPLYDLFASWKNTWGIISIVSGLIGAILWKTLSFFVKNKSSRWILSLPSFLLGLSLFSSSRWFFEESVEASHNSQIVWYDNEEEALQVAKKKSLPLLIDFWAEWCAACKKMDISTFTDDNFIREVKKNNVIFLKLDVTKDSDENTQLLEKYKVQGLPTLIIIKPGSDEPVIVSGYASPVRLLNYINE